MILKNFTKSSYKKNLLKKNEKMKKRLPGVFLIIFLAPKTAIIYIYKCKKGRLFSKKQIKIKNS